MTAPLGSSDTLTYPWRIEQGERDGIVVTVVDADGAPVTVDGWVVDAKVKAAPGGAVLYSWPADLAVATGTEVEVHVPVSVSSTWTFRRAWYRVKVTDPAGTTDDPKVSRIVQGYLSIDPD